MKKSSKILIIIVLFFFSLVSGILVAQYFHDDQDTEGNNTQQNNSTNEEPAKNPSVKKSDHAKFIATGDNLIHGAIYTEARKRGGDHYDFNYPYAHTEAYFKNFDFKYINQETLVNDAVQPSHYPRFSTPIAVGDKVVSMGFNIINTSNNHSYDQGAKGIASSVKYWNSKAPDVIHIGFYGKDLAKNVKYLTKNNIKLGFIACTYATNGLEISDPDSDKIVNCDDFDTLGKMVDIAKKNSDSVIISAHWGDEDSTTINDYQRNVAEKLSSMGVDVIIGNHPHVIQSIEWYTSKATGHKTLICYSLGNFISAQFPAKNLVGGLFQFDIEKKYDANGDFDIIYSNPAFVPIVTHYDPNGEHTKNIRNYLLRDYTDELAANHGAKSRGFSRQYALDLVKKIIPAEFLKLD